MKVRKAIILGIFVLISTETFAQRWGELPQVGIATADTENTSYMNIAALRKGNASGVGWNGFWEGPRITANAAHVVLGPVAYNYRQFPGVNNHEVGGGFAFADEIYLGMSGRWDQGTKAGFNLHVLYMPSDWFSLGVKGESLNFSPWMDYGLSIKPLMFDEDWISRLVLFYDGRVEHSGIYRNIACGFRTSPIDELEVFGHWDFRFDNFTIGINISIGDFVKGLPLLGGEVSLPGRSEAYNGVTKVFLPLPIEFFQREPKSLYERLKEKAKSEDPKNADE